MVSFFRINQTIQARTNPTAGAMHMSSRISQPRPYQPVAVKKP